MASLVTRDTSRGRRYDVRYRDPAGKVHTRTFDKRNAADAFASTVEADKLRGAWVDPSADRTTLALFSARWLDQRNLRPRTRDLYRGVLDRHILPALGDVALARITTATVAKS